MGFIFELRFRPGFVFFLRPGFVWILFRFMNGYENRMKHIFTHIGLYWTIWGFVGTYLHFVNLISS